MTHYQTKFASKLSVILSVGVPARQLVGLWGDWSKDEALTRTCVILSLSKEEALTRTCVILSLSKDEIVNMVKAVI